MIARPANSMCAAWLMNSPTPDGSSHVQWMLSLLE